MTEKESRNVIREKSCGAVIFCTENGRTRYLIEHMRQGHYALCKGHMEAGETERETAEREILEETGLNVQVDTAFRETLEYSPYHGCIKEVVYFIARAGDTDTVPQPEEVGEIVWAEAEEAQRLLTFDNDRGIFQNAVRFIEKTAG